MKTKTFVLAFIIGLFAVAVWADAGFIGEPSTSGVPVSGGQEHTVYITDNTGDFNGITYSSITAYTGTDDTEIKQAIATTNYGSETSFEATNWAESDITRGLLSFPGLSNIPSGATITSVTLGISVLDHPGSETRTITLNRVLKSWSESQATWNIYSTGNNWDSGGCGSSGSDYVATVSDSFGVASTGWLTMTDTSGQLLDDVQGFVDGSYSNYGWRLVSDGAYGAGDEFSSSEGYDNNRPYLQVEYTY